MDVNDIASAMALKFDSMCRACLHCNNIETPLELQFIHDYIKGNDVQDIQTIAQWLKHLAPSIEIEPEDGLPEHICASCLEQLLNFRSFQQICLKADKHVRALQNQKYIHIALAEPTMLMPNDSALFSDENEYKPDVMDLDRQRNTAKDTLTDVLAVNKAEESYDANEFKECKSEQNSNDGANMEASEFLSDTDEEPCVSDTPLAQQKHNLYRRTTCNVCGKQFRHIKRHKQVHLTEGRPYQCAHCDYRFTSTAKLKSHLTKMHAGVQLSNDMHTACDLASNENKLRLTNDKARISLTREHKQLEADSTQPKYKCEQCAKTFHNTRALGNHQRHHSPKKLVIPAGTRHEGKYECQFCKKTFQQLSTLREHVRIHTGEQLFLCPECGKSFNSSSNMKQHLLRHTGELRYECPMCPRRFPCLSDLSSHKSQVHDVGKYTCEVCPKRFAKPYLLKKHMMYHNGEKPYKCDSCGMRFVCPNHMRRHMRVHTGEKPYQCKYCERAFAQSNDLIKHLRTHVGEHVYKCEMCPQSFRLARELRSHFASHKEVDENSKKDKHVPIASDLSQDKLS